MSRRYGLPYQGSKNQIAEELLSFLPPGNRFVDLFGGGGSMTDCAMDSYKWDSFLYNEINPLVVKAFKMAVYGFFKKDRRWISREEFFRLKDTDPYVAFCFSFSNNLTDYAYSREIEPWKKALHYARVYNCNYPLREMGIYLKDASPDTIRENADYIRKQYKKGILKSESNQCNLQSLKSLERLESLERLQNLEQLEKIEGMSYHKKRNLKITQGSYEDYEYEDGDVVYCDIPYESTDCKSYKGFDSKRFYDWCATRPYQVFFSSYEISDNRFHRIWEREKRVTSGLDNSLQKTECLYTNEPYVYSSLLGKQFEFDFG